MQKSQMIYYFSFHCSLPRKMLPLGKSTELKDLGSYFLDRHQGKSLLDSLNPSIEIFSLMLQNYVLISTVINKGVYPNVLGTLVISYQ